MNNLVNPTTSGNINQYGFGSFIKKIGKKIKNTAKDGLGLLHDGILTGFDNSLGIFGAGDLIDDSSYKTKFGEKFSNITSEVISPIIGQVAATAIGGPIGGQLMGQVQGQFNKEPEIVQQSNDIDLTGLNQSFSTNYSVNPLTNNNAYGGFVDSTNVNVFNEGGTHENNPYGGVPIGMGPNGKMNTVEEGEVSIDLDGEKYIFSDRLNFGEDVEKLLLNY